ncbi:hypothetical protein PQR10_34190, partial [Paraburkholderia phytofirmans]|uniref:hypothetical protein n=1 Tax=Paraburkholderia phytofirmans TaxID=261302 RepID=UPI0038BBA555
MASGFADTFASENPCIQNPRIGEYLVQRHAIDPAPEPLKKDRDCGVTEAKPVDPRRRNTTTCLKQTVPASAQREAGRMSAVSQAPNVRE